MHVYISDIWLVAVCINIIRLIRAVLNKIWCQLKYGLQLCNMRHYVSPDLKSAEDI